MGQEQDPKYYAIPRPPQDVFSKDIRVNQRLDTIGARLIKEVYPTEEEGGGIYLYYENHAFPYKGYPFPEAVNSIAAPKKFLKGLAWIVWHHKILSAFVGLGTFFFSNKLWNSLYRGIVDIFLYGNVFQWRLEHFRYCDSVREIRRAGFVVAERRRGWVVDALKQIFEIVGIIFEYDNAWRYRMQDVIGELDKDLFRKNPRKEIARITRIGSERERSWASHRNQYNLIGLAMRVLMFVRPSFKKLVVEFVEELDLNKVKMDIADLYYNYVRPDYDTQGLPFERRIIERTKLDNLYRQKVESLMKKKQEDEPQGQAKTSA